MYHGAVADPLNSGLAYSYDSGEEPRRDDDGERVAVLNRWWLPFLSMTVVPILVAAFAYVLFPEKRNDLEIGLRTLPAGSLGSPSGDEYYKLETALFAIVAPGGLYLLPWLWVRSTASSTRSSAVISGVAGLLVLAALLVAVLSYGWISAPDGSAYLEDDGPNGWLGDNGIVTPLGAIWLVCILTSILSLLLVPTFWLVRRLSLAGTQEPPLRP